MGKGKGFKLSITIVILFVMMATFVVLFYTCSQNVDYSVEEPEPEPIPVYEEIPEVVVPEAEPEVIIEVPEEPVVEVIAEEPVVEVVEVVEEVIAEPEPVVEPAVEPVVEVITEPEPVVEPVVEVITEPESVVEPVVEVITEPESVIETVEETIEEPVAETGIRVPEAPDLDWMVETNLIQENAVWTSPFGDSNIDWSEFVFSDQEVILPDGTYYAQLYVNETAFGTIQIEQINGEPNFLKSSLEVELTGTLADEFYASFFQAEGPYYKLSYIEELAEAVSYDSTNLVLRLNFNSYQVPIQTLSLGSSSYSILRQNYDVVGNVVIQPAKFSFQTNISGFINTTYDRRLFTDGLEGLTGLSATVNLSNTFSFWNMTFSLPITLSYVKNSGVIPSIGSWSGYLDLPSDNLRLSFGNVGNAGFSKGSPFGVTLEKSYSYGTGTAMGNQYSQTITLTEDSNVVIKINGNVVFDKNLALGIYRLTDFAFVQGSNDISVTIHPLAMGEDTTQDQTLTFDQNYDSSLMGLGESTWRFGVSIPKIKQEIGRKDSTGFGYVVPALPTYTGKRNGWQFTENMYSFDALSVFWEQSVGISHVYTQSHSFSFIFERNADSSDKPGEYSATFAGNLSGTLATKFGITRATVNGIVDSTNSDRLSATLNMSQSFANEFLKPISLSGSYQFTPALQTVSLNTGYSFSLKNLRMSMSLSSSYKFASMRTKEEIEKPLSVNGSISLSTSLGPKVSFSLNSSINQDFQFYATASLSWSISNNQSANTSFSTNDGKKYTGNAGWFFRTKSTSRNSFQLNLSNINFADLTSHALSGSWTRSGDYVNMSLRTQASNMYKRFSTTLSLNTALAFADGQFALANSLYGPFLIIDPQGALKDASISVSSATEASSTTSKKTFNNVLYTKLSMYKPTNVVVYASNGSLFSSSGSFLFKITPVARQGFLAKIDLETSIAVSGVLKRTDATVYESYSSPIYKVTLDENGVDVKSIEIDPSSFFFTDIDGRFILSDLKAGLYMIDLEVGGEWYAAFFEVPEPDAVGYVGLYQDYVSDKIMGMEVMEKYNIKSFDDSYAGSVYIQHDRFITESDYWDMLFAIQSEDTYNFDDWEFEEDYNDYEQITQVTSKVNDSETPLS